MALLCVLTTMALDPGMVQATVLGQVPAPMAVALRSSYIADDVFARRQRVARKRYPSQVTAANVLPSSERIVSFAEAADWSEMNEAVEQTGPQGQPNMQLEVSRGDTFTSIVRQYKQTNDGIASPSMQASQQGFAMNPDALAVSYTVAGVTSYESLTSTEMSEALDHPTNSDPSSVDHPAPSPPPAPHPQPAAEQPPQKSPAPLAPPAVILSKSEAPSPSVIPADKSVDYRLADIAKRLLGIPYVWGGTSTSGFDCSGFTQYVAAQAGFTIPRTSWSQYAVGQTVGGGALQPGDLVFFSTDADGASHVGIYVGARQFVHADLRRGVAVTDMDQPYWQTAYVGARRLTPDLRH